MPTKKGAGGREQNYNARTGKYEKIDYATLYYTPQTKREKAQRKRNLKQEELFNRALKSRDKYLLETFCEIEKALPYHVQYVNELKFDPFIKDNRELDIITKKCIIEVKDKQVKRCLKQFLAQKRYAEYKNKQHIVFSPNIPTMTKLSYEKYGIKIVKDFSTLIKTIKEHE